MRFFIFVPPTTVRPVVNPRSITACSTRTISNPARIFSLPFPIEFPSDKKFLSGASIANDVNLSFKTIYMMMKRVMLILFVLISVAVSKLGTSNGNLRVPVSVTSTIVLQRTSVTNSSTLLQTNGAKKGHSKVPIDDIFLIGTIKLGGKPFKVIFDSGSRALWVFGKDVNKEYFANDEPWFSHSFYDEQESRTFTPYNHPEDTALCASTQYVDGCSTEGTVGFEELTIGDIVVPGTRFQITKKLKGPVDQFTRYDGICGLGLEHSVSQESPMSPFVKMVEDGGLESNMFSVYIGKEGSGEGEIMFGGYDPKRMYNPVVEMVSVMQHPKMRRATDWMVRVSKVGFGNFRKVLTAYAYIDTGTSIVVLPKPMLKSLPDHPSLQPLLNALLGVNGNHHAYVPCDSRHMLPTIRMGRTIRQPREDNNRTSFQTLNIVLS